MSEINSEVEKMMKAGHPQSAQIKDRKGQLNERSEEEQCIILCLGLFLFSCSLVEQGLVLSTL